MLDSLSYEELRKTVGESFLIDYQGLQLAVRLAELTDRSLFGQQECFSLVFHGERGTILPQDTYSLQHPSLNTSEIFLGPVSENEDGIEYEAVFNRLVVDS